MISSDHLKGFMNLFLKKSNKRQIITRSPAVISKEQKVSRRMNRTASNIRPWREQEVKGSREHKAEVHRTVPAFPLNFMESSESVQAILKAITEKDCLKGRVWRLQDILPDSRKPIARCHSK